MAEFKQISVAVEDYDMYEELRNKLTEELGARVSLATTLKIGMTFYKQRRKLAKDGEES